MTRKLRRSKNEHRYLDTQCGNPGRRSELLQSEQKLICRVSWVNRKGEDQPNKKYYDPRVWLRAGQTSMIARLEKAFQELNAIDVL